MKERTMGGYRGFYRAMPIPGAAILSLLFLIPLCVTLSSAFFEDGAVTTARIVSVFTDSYTLRIMGFTLLQAALSTLASLLVGLPGAYLLANRTFRGKRLIKAICTVPFVIPSILVVLGFVIFFGNNGFLNKALMGLFHLQEPPIHILYSFPAIILAHTFYNFPIVMNLVSSYWEHMDYHCEQAASTLGASKGHIFRTITLPRLMPSILSAASLVFLFCFNSFAIILVLGGGPRFTTMEVEIYRLARMSMDTGGAAAMSIFSILVTSLLLFGYSLGQKHLARSERFLTRTVHPTTQGSSSVSAKILIAIYAVFSLVFVMGPLLSIVVRSFTASATRSAAQQFSLKWYRQLFALETGTGHMGSALPALEHSLLIAALVALLTVPMALTMCTAIRKKGGSSTFLELFGMLPMTVSSVMIGLGYYIISSHVRGTTGLQYTLVVLAHMVIAIPFVLRSILPEYRKIPQTYIHSALTLGAGPLKTFITVEVPLLKTAMLTGGIFAFALSMGEINATLTLANSTLVTLPIVMYRLIGSYNFQGACALGTVLIFVCVLVFAIGETKGTAS